MLTGDRAGFADELDVEDEGEKESKMVSPTSWMEWHMPPSSALRRLEQEGRESEATVGCTARLSFT